MIRNNGYIELYGLRMRDNVGIHEFANGSKRDSQEDKIRFGLIWTPFIEMLAAWCTMGAVKYSPDNWKKGQPLHQYRDSILRHIYAAIEGKTDESHFIAAAWNIMAWIYTEQACLAGHLPEYYLTCGANKRFTEEEYLKWENERKKGLTEN